MEILEVIIWIIILVFVVPFLLYLYGNMLAKGIGSVFIDILEKLNKNNNGKEEKEI